MEHPAPFVPYDKNLKGWNDLVVAEDYIDQKSKKENKEMDEWAFRGQDTLDFPASTLERHCKKLDITGSKIVDLEVKLIRDFARSYHLYTNRVLPPKGYTLEWLSLLNHYGTATRLVDCTYSFFIAAYFALEDLEKGNACAVVWAVNVTQLAKAAKKHIGLAVANGQNLFEKFKSKRDEKPFRDLFMARPHKFVLSTNPIRLNERLTVQQGRFLAPGDVTVSFEENLRAVPNHSSYVMQFIIDGACRQECLRKLHRMGINRATLFPDLEGFAKSLRTKSLILKDLPEQSVKQLKEV